MKLDSEGLRELYQRETARSARGSAGDCLTEDMLVRAGAGELNESERERAADHLAICSDCAKEYRAINSLRSWALPASDNGQPRPMAVEPMLHETQIGSRRVSFYLPYAIAAAAVVLSLAFGALLVSKWRENQRLIAEANNRQSTQNAEDLKTEEALAESRRLLEETNRRVEQESAARRVAEEELAKRNAADRSANQTRPGAAQDQRAAPDVNVPIID